MNLVPKIHDYIRSKGGKFFDGWTREALEDKILFHIKEGTISVAADGSENICGLMIGWCQDGCDHIPWAWQKNNIHGSYWWIDQFMADNPESAAAVAINFCERWPMIAAMPTVGYRRGKIRVNKPGHLFEIYKKAEKIYGN